MPSKKIDKNKILFAESYLLLVESCCQYISFIQKNEKNENLWIDDKIKISLLYNMHHAIELILKIFTNPKLNHDIIKTFKNSKEEIEEIISKGISCIEDTKFHNSILYEYVLMNSPEKTKEKLFYDLIILNKMISYYQKGIFTKTNKCDKKNEFFRYSHDRNNTPHDIDYTNIISNEDIINTLQNDTPKLRKILRQLQYLQSNQ